MDSQIVSALIGLIGAVVGGVIVGSAVLWQTRRMLTEQNRQREKERERETKSVATALLWEIDDFYRLFIRNVSRALKDKKLEDLGFDVKSLTLSRFTIYEESADKVGLFEPALVQGIVGWYGNARAYLNTIHDYGQTIEQIQSGQHQLRKKAVALLTQIQESAASFVPLTRTVCEALAALAGGAYTFDVP